MGSTEKRWRFEGNEHLIRAGAVTLRGEMDSVMENVDENDSRGVLYMSQGDPTDFPSFRTTTFAEDAISNALCTAHFNGYASPLGVPAARSAVAEYLTRDLPYTLPPDNVFMTVGCTQAIEAILTSITVPGANILLPRPGYPDYEARAAFTGLEVRHFDLLPERDWEVDLDSVEAEADENTVALVIINPGNPCGNVFTYEHLKKIAETARKLGIMVITDEVYGHMTFGGNPFVRMGVFASIAPIVSLGSGSKRWIVPGWRIGWLVLNDLNGVFAKHGIVESIKAFLNSSSDPVSFVQAALPEIVLKTPTDFYSKTLSLFKESAERIYQLSNQIPCLSCPTKPNGGLFFMIKLNLSELEGVNDDSEFCCKLAKEESVILVPGIGLGLKNWVRICFAMEIPYIEDGFRRITAFSQRHANKIKHI